MITSTVDICLDPIKLLDEPMNDASQFIKHGEASQAMKIGDHLFEFYRPGNSETFLALDEGRKAVYPLGLIEDEKDKTPWRESPILSCVRCWRCRGE